jgi:hypothetical protein
MTLSLTTGVLDNLSDTYRCHRCGTEKSSDEFTLGALMHVADRPYDLICKPCRKADRATRDPLLRDIAERQRQIRNTRDRIAVIAAKIDEANGTGWTSIGAQAHLGRNKHELADAEANLAKHEATLADLIAQREARK